MDLKLSQATRAARLTTPLGEDELVIVRFDATEGLSELFEFRIEALSKNEVDFDNLLGKSCTVEIKMYGLQRHFTGMLVEGQWTGMKYEHHVYRLVLRPWLWFHSRKSDCRIFQNMTAPDIIKKVLDLGDVQLLLQESYPQLEYCVQYRETDLAFVSRLMEHHGIYYFFKHSAGSHSLVLADMMSSHEAVPGLASIPFIPLANAERRDRQHIYHWVAERRFRSGKVMLNDYYELTPSSDISAKKSGNARYAGADRLELYDYPGKYKKRSDGEKYAQVAIEAEQAFDQRRHTAGNAVNLFPGGTTQVDGHKKSSENQDFLVVRASHSYVAEHYRSEAATPEEDYRGNFELLPKKGMVFRAPIVTPRPVIHGSQTAVVTGPAGEEIYVDKYGRIKVQFHWDRYGKKDQDSSCWIRVAERWSGKKWGTQETPRIGMEVLVDFLEGDPDQPLVAGTVYNADYMHPFELPGNKTQSGIKSNSSLRGDGFNQFRFEDKKSFEEINMHAEKDHNVKVRHAETWEIGEAFMPPTGMPSREVSIKMGDDKLTIETGSRKTEIALMDELKANVLIKFECGASKITMTPVSIMIESPLISLSGALIKIN